MGYNPPAMHVRHVAQTLAPLLTGVVLCVGTGGCVAYRGNTIPRIDSSTVAVPRMQRTVTYDLKIDSEVGDDYELNGIAERQLLSTLRLAGADMKPSGSYADPDATMSATLTANGSVIAQFLSGFICGLTYTVIPAYASTDFALDAQVSSRDGVRRQYHYADTYTVWIELLLFPFSNSPDRVKDELIADMARSLARDMQRDGLLPAPR